MSFCLHFDCLTFIQINLIAAPLFVITAQTMEREEGIKKVENALNEIKSKIESYHGSFKIIMAPKIVTDLEDEERRLELEEDNDDDDAGSSAGEDDDGLVAPKGLNEEADQEEEARKGKPTNDDEESD